MDKPTPQIVGHMPDGEAIYSLPAIPAPIKGCEADPEFPCLTCILNELVPISKKLNESMERMYKRLLELKEIRIDDGVTELHVKTATDQLRMRLAFASAVHDTITQTLLLAKQNLR